MSTPDTPTGVDLINSFGHRHPDRDNCLECGDDILRAALVSLCYRFVECDCDAADYTHLAERVAHLDCMAYGGSVDAATADMLRSAVHTLRRYKRGQQKADRIEAFLATARTGNLEIGSGPWFGLWHPDDECVVATTTCLQPCCIGDMLTNFPHLRVISLDAITAHADELEAAGDSGARETP